MALRLAAKYDAIPYHEGGTSMSRRRSQRKQTLTKRSQWRVWETTRCAVRIVAILIAMR